MAQTHPFDRVVELNEEKQKLAQERESLTTRLNREMAEIEN